MEQCSIIGKTLGRIHSSSKNFKKKQNLRDNNWIILNYYKVISFLNKKDQKLMFYQVYLLKKKSKTPQKQKHLVKKLPQGQGIIHSDLFRDNTLFYGNKLCGLIDFYNGCTVAVAVDWDLIFDLSILLNDWGREKYGDIIEDKYKAILNNYIIEIERHFLHLHLPFAFVFVFVFPFRNEELYICIWLWPLYFHFHFHFPFPFPFPLSLSFSFSFSFSFVLRVTALRYWITRLLVTKIFIFNLIPKHKVPKNFRNILVSLYKKKLPSLF
ncbi:Homoserine kinase [Candidatus Portiera aleyrodidarum]|uniref:Homoserine kinase n=1 Tax=Candidatus Portiera aleyrodidarum TaxID=91844 RepID=A0A6S6S3Z6_9GAMM|nr:phosphotransferase [Candidatus Portiera aleyrodidarum]CAA3704444.1 Homoserine kinase [Candidatus Portiera aleyrodidarum]